jgi:homoserine kinase type II
MNLLMQINKLYPNLNIARLEPLGSAGGFSGSELWKCHSTATLSNQTYCLRRWPTEHPDDAQLSWIHRVIRHADAQGCQFLAAPLMNSHDETISRFPCEDPGERVVARWELTCWLPGKADFASNPNKARIQNMMRSLAQFHQASAQVTLDFHTSQNLRRRIEQLNQVLQSDVLRQLANSRTSNRSSINSDLHGELNRDLNRLLDELVQLLSQHAPRLVKGLLTELPTSAPSATSLWAIPVLPVQPILRDIWHDHVLFTGDEVTGMVDYGAMQIDNVAFDIARLLATTVADDQASWESGLDAYEATRRLSALERALIPWLDGSGILLGSLNWLRWLLVEQRNFADWKLVSKRLQFLYHRLQFIANSGWKRDF